MWQRTLTLLSGVILFAQVDTCMYVPPSATPTVTPPIAPEFSLDQAQSLVDFPIRLPAYVPVGFQIRYLWVEPSYPSEKPHLVNVVYSPELTRPPMQFLYVRQTRSPLQPWCEGPDDRVFIQGTTMPATKLPRQEGWVVASSYWETNGLRFCAVAAFEQDESGELLRMLDSLMKQ